MRRKLNKPRAPQANRNTSGLRPFQPGQSGNPGGRPKKQPVTDALRELIEQGAIPKARPETLADQLARQLVRQALKGKLAPLVEIIDRVEGKARQRVEQSGPDGGPIPLELPGTREEVERRINELLKQAKGGRDARTAQTR
jgi:hypothetical protein